MPIYLIVAIAVAMLLMVILILVSLNFYGYIMRSKADRNFVEIRTRQEAEWNAVIARRDTPSSRTKYDAPSRCNPGIW